MENQKEIFINKQAAFSDNIKVCSFLVLASVVFISLAKSHPNFSVMVEGLSSGLAGTIIYKNLISLKAKSEEYKTVSIDTYKKLKKDVKLSSFALLGVVAGLQLGVMSEMTTQNFMFSSYISLVGLSVAQFRSNLAFNSLKENKKSKALNKMTEMRDFYTKEDKTNSIKNTF